MQDSVFGKKSPIRRPSRCLLSVVFDDFGQLLHAHPVGNDFFVLVQQVQLRQGGAVVLLERPCPHIGVGGDNPRHLLLMDVLDGLFQFRAVGGADGKHLHALVFPFFVKWFQFVGSVLAVAAARFPKENYGEVGLYIIRADKLVSELVLLRVVALHPHVRGLLADEHIVVHVGIVGDALEVLRRHPISDARLRSRSWRPA